MKNYLITGTKTGLGSHIKEQLLAIGKTVYDDPELDLSIMNNVSQLSQRYSEIDCLINCAGTSYIDWFPKADWRMYDHLMDLNLKAPLYLVQSMLRYGSFAKSPTVFNVISIASHLPMTNTTFYNASKGALHIATLQLARELKKTHDITVLGLSPNKMKGTKMSEYIDNRVPELRGWTKEEAAEYQKKTLAAGEETDPAEVARFICFLLSEKAHHKYLNGCIMPYGAA